MMLEHEPHLDWARKELPPRELRFLACLLSHSVLLPRGFELVRSTDFGSVWGGRVFEELIVARHEIAGVQPQERISILARRLIRYDPAAHERLDAVYTVGLYDPPELYPSAASLEHFAIEIVENAQLRYRQALVEAREFGTEQLEKLLAYQKRIDTAGAGDTYLETGYSGDALLALSAEPVPEPVVPGLLWPGHVNVLAGRTKIGKTFLVCHVMVSLTLGRHAWSGAITARDEVPRILMLSRDDTTSEIARRMRHLEPSQQAWANELVIVGKERKPQSLDEEGILALRTTLEVARRQERSFAGVVLDPYTHFLPPGGKMNEDETASQLITALEAICTDFSCWVWVLHHMRKRPAQRKEMDDEDLLDELRGSGAIANLSRAVAFLEKREGHLRRLVSFSNVGPTPMPQLLQVCDEGTDRIDRWVPVTSTATPIGELMGHDEEFNQTDYVRRRLGIPYPKKPSQAQRRAIYPDFLAAITSGDVTPTKKLKNSQHYTLDGSARQCALERSNALRSGEGPKRSVRSSKEESAPESALPSTHSLGQRAAPEEGQLPLSPPSGSEEDEDELPY